MSFLNKLFGSKKAEVITLNSPLNGEILDTKAIPDPTFADCVLGPTICFKPGEDGTIYAPCDGTVTQIFKTAHAITITSTDKVELLIHVGINTVDLKGEGFEAFVKDDDVVKCGQPLIKFDQTVIAKAGLSNLVPVVICNAMDFNSIEFAGTRSVTTTDKFCFITPSEK